MSTSEPDPADPILDAERHRRLADEALRRVEFARELERIMTSLGLDLLDRSTELSASAIESAMGDIGELVGADRVYVFEFDDGTDTLSNTFEWCAPGVEPVIDMLQDLPRSVYPWAMRQLAEQELVVTRIADLPAEASAEREILADQQIQAVMWIPLQREGRTVGFVGFDQVSVVAEWTEYDERALRHFGSTLSLAVARYRSQVALRESEERLQRFAANLDVAMFIADQDLAHGEFLNPAYTELTGISPEAFRSDPAQLLTIVHPDDAPELDLQLRRFLVTLADPGVSSPTLDRTFRLTAREQLRWVRLRAFALDEGDGRRRVGALLDDVTEVRRLHDTLTGALDRVAAANRAKTEFLSRMSHELRSPLQGTLGFLELLRLEPDSPDRETFIDHAERSARHLVELIDDLLLVGRIEAGRLELDHSRVDLGALVRDVVELHVPMSADRAVDVSVEVRSDATVRTDERRLGQILGNLVSNAIKYCRVGGTVTVVVRHDGAEPVIEVVDTGPGISEENLARIFVPFERLDAERQGIAGTGIGLVVVEQLASALGARLEVESTLGVGSTFRVVLPSPPDDASTTEPTRAGRVLLVEDSLESRLVIESALRRVDGVQLRTAVDLEAGFAAAVLDRPDLVLLDRHLPDGDGIDAIPRFSALADAEHPVRVAVVSADAEPESRARAVRAGATAYFVKPIRLKELVDFVSDQLDRLRAER